MYFAYRLEGLLSDMGYDNTKRHRVQRHAFWHAVWLAHYLTGASKGLLDGSSIQQIIVHHHSENRWSTARRELTSVRRLEYSDIAH